MRNEKVVLVTGSGKGIGRGIALEFARAGYEVAVHYNTSKEEGLSACDEITALGVKCILLQGDTGEADVPERLVKQTIAQLGRLDVYVANAGAFRGQKLMELTADAMDWLYHVNFRGMILGAKAAAQYMVENNVEGSLLFNTSVRAYNAHMHDCIYGAFKAGMNRAIESFAMDLGRYGIRVNGFAPGIINVRCAPEEESEHPFYKNTHRFVPLRKNGRAADIGKAVVWLASENASYVSGAVLKVDGGLAAVGAPEEISVLEETFDLSGIYK
ncbi:MAG: SDR family oxidoreductase [Christensenellaceae bacterium]|jgi:NAD(P)-dependent dehydrogenase (short-subunit alcohol dehydrogenase family)|nr:SDR family oxidoreductase [Christensenellaceae bacterium]